MTRAELRQIIVPTPAQIEVCAGLSLGLFIIIYHDLLANRFFGRELAGVSALSPYINQSYAIALGQVSGLTATDLIVKAAFFAGVGLIAYIIFLFISNVLIEARNEVVVETEYANKGDFTAQASKPLKQIGLAIGLFIFLIWSAQAALPLWLHWFEAWLFGPIVSLWSWLGLLLALAGCTLNAYLVWTLAQIIFAIE